MSKINSLREIFDYLKFQKTITSYSDLELNSGIRSRINGKGTSPKSKETELRPEEKNEVVKAVRANCNDILDYLDKSENNG